MPFIKNLSAKSLILFLAFATFFAGCMPRGERALRDGQELIEQGRYAEAIERLKQATALLSTNAQAWNYLGLACHHAGRVAEAAQAYQVALSNHRDLMEARFNLGCLWLEQNRLNDAVAELTAFTVRRANSPEGWIKLGTAQLRSREFADAERSFREALELSPQNPEALNGLGLIQLQRHRAPRDAVQSFNKALLQRPDYPPALLNLAIVSQSYLNNRTQALEKYRAYLAAPDSVADREAVTAMVGTLEQELGVATRPVPANTGAPRNLKSPQSKDTARMSAPASVPARRETVTNAVNVRAGGTALSNATMVPVSPGPPAGSLPVVQSAPATSPPTRASSTGVVAMAANAGQPVVSSQSNPASPVRTETKPPPAPVSPRRVETSQTVPDEARVVPESVPSGAARYHYITPPAPTPGDHASAVSAFAQGTQAQEAGRWSEAMQAYRRAAQLDPAYYEACYNLALAAKEAGDLRQSLAAYESALAIRPDSLDARYNFALVLKQANYPVDAAIELERILLTHPNESRAHLALGNLYAQQLRQPARAREHYLKVLDIDPRNPQASAIRYWLSAYRP